MTGPSAAGTAAAIFDVDGTLCATRSTTSLVWLRQRQSSPWQHRRWLASLAWRAPLVWAADRFSRDAADRLVYAQFAGLSGRRLQDDAERCCETVLLPSCFPAALVEIAAHRQAKRRLILVSGGLEVVLAPLARALGAEQLAQRLVADGDRMTGVHRSYAVLDGLTHPANQSERKAAALRCYAKSEGVDLRASVAYGDSINDLGMLEAVGTPVAVNPDRALARIAAARGWDTRRWRLTGQ
jgi:HAD superfamily hydrolase (TIGR01490 family)